MECYALIKYMAALWITAQTRKNSNIRFITMSPGATGGTDIMNDLKGFKKIMYKHIMMPFILPLMGISHSLETGAKRFIKAINDSSLINGVFYASKTNKPTGEIINQNTFLTDFDNIDYQNNVNEAIHLFIK